ncbi:hypothetical protein [Anaerocolumna sp.]|uniref:hypothetical protein n=1 Tax=Anaerocolumna sp. TaxID=2041569 RepID=UPI0028AB5E24|nr:hypothetical protein [Anaerocolumna sp.]
MINVSIGLICLGMSIFILFFSPKESYKNNALGYKSPQLNTHKNIWFWTNKCFGLLALPGSILYLLISIILVLTGHVEFSTAMNRYLLIYIGSSIIITEIYGLTKKINDKKNVHR